MATKIAGTPFYELKIINPSAIANYNGGHLVKSIGDDMSQFLGKPTQGLVVKESLAAKLVEKVKKDLIARKVEQPIMRAGLSGKDVVFVVTDAKNAKYEESCVLVAGYVPLRDKLKSQLVGVVNMQRGDKVIDDSTETMADAHGMNAINGDDMHWGVLPSNSTPLILLAHGDEDKNSTGQIFGKDFAGKTPAQLVTILLDNPDKNRALNKKYAGTIYLDGCFTAQGGAMENYTKQVWELLKRRGMKNVKVKGNLGLAATTGSGDEIITTSEAEAKAERLIATARTERQKLIRQRSEAHNKLRRTYAGPDGDQQYRADPKFRLIEDKAEESADAIRKKLEKDLAKIPGYRVPNLVGQFGLERLN